MQNDEKISSEIHRASTYVDLIYLYLVRINTQLSDKLPLNSCMSHISRNNQVCHCVSEKSKYKPL